MTIRHDFAFTIHVLHNLVDRYSQDVILRVKSDNCSSQYCSLHVFEDYRTLSKELNKTLIVYYGVNGHGRRLVDALSGFGVKSPLRRDIVTDNFMFHMVIKLQDFNKFDQCGKDNIDVINNDKIVSVDETDNAEPDMYLMVEPNSYIVMYSKPK